MGLLNIVLFGVFISLYAVREGSLWGVCGWHAAWNWLLGLGFGLEVSGMKIDSLPLITDLTGAPGAAWWLTGASFGPEASLVTTAVPLAGTVVLRPGGRTPGPGGSEAVEVRAGDRPGHPLSGVALKEPILRPPDEADRHLQGRELGIAEGVRLVEGAERRTHGRRAVGEVKERASEPEKQRRAGEERLPDGGAVAIGLDADHPADALPILLAIAARNHQKKPGDEVGAGEGQPHRDPAAQADTADRHCPAGEQLLDELGQGAGSLRDRQGRLRTAGAAERRKLRQE